MLRTSSQCTEKQQFFSDNVAEGTYINDHVDGNQIVYFHRGKYCCDVYVIPLIFMDRIGTS